jgi:heme O synthase-like polyprenyltransferase
MERGSSRSEPRAEVERSAAMLFAFALAIVGIVVLGSFEYVAAHTH